MRRLSRLTRLPASPDFRPMQPIIPIRRKDPFDDPAWLFELKLDGFRGLADTVNGRMLSKNGNRLRRIQRLLDALPPGNVFESRDDSAMGEHRHTAAGPPERYRLTDRHGSQCARKMSFLSPSVRNWRSLKGTTVLQIAL